MRTIKEKHWLSNKIYNGSWLFKIFLRGKYYKIRNTMKLRATHVDFHDDIITNGKIIISNCGDIHIGKRVVLNSGVYPNPVGTSLTRIYTEKSSSEVFIGNNVGMSSTLIYSTNKIVIEDDVLIGAETMIFDTDFHGLLYCGNGVRSETLEGIPILIKKGAFIGAKSIILKGVTIGEGAVVGAGSVVTSDIPKGEIWAGNPARFLKKIKEG